MKPADACLCGSSLSFGTDTNGRLVERCDGCHTERVVVPRRPSPEESEASRRASGMRLPRCRICGGEPSSPGASTCDDCRKRKQRADGKASHEPEHIGRVIDRVMADVMSRVEAEQGADA